MKGPAVFVLSCALALAAGLPALGERDFWPPDEARYGGVALEQARGGHHPLIPHLNGKLYPDKPAVYFLAIEGAARLLHGRVKIDEAASRLPSVIAGAVAVGCVSWWVTAALGPGTGLLAGLLLLGSSLFSWQLRYVQMDMLLAGVCCLMMAAFWRAMNGGSRWWCTAGWLALTLGIAVKGPMALLVFAAAPLFAVISKRPRGFFNFGSLVGLLACAGTIAGGLLFIRGVPEGQAYVDDLLGRHVAERAAKGLAHVKPWYAYAGILSSSLMPIAPLLLLGLQRSVRQRVPERARPLLLFAVVWALLVVVVASTQAGKRSVYLLPMFPAIAIITAILAHAASHAGVRWCARYAAAVGIFGLIVGGAFIGVGSSSGFLPWLIEALDGVSGDRITKLLEKRAYDPNTESLRAAFLFAGRWAAGAALLTTIVAFTRGGRAAVGCLAGFTAVAVCAFSVSIAPELDATISRRAAASTLHRVERARGVSGPISFFHHLDEGVAFYVGRVIPEVPGQAPGAPRLAHEKPADREAARSAVRAALAPKDALMIARLEDLEDFALSDDADYREVARTRVGRRWFILMEAAR